MDPDEEQQPAIIKVSDSASLDRAIAFFSQNYSQGDPTVCLFFRLKRNRDDIQDERIMALLDAIEATSARINYVRIKMTWITERDEATRNRFCQVVGGIASLGSLALAEGRSSRALPLISSILMGARNLHILWINLISFRQNLTEFAAAIQHHPALKRILFTDCDCGPADETFPSRGVNSILAALGTVPNLNVLSLPAWVPSDQDENGVIDASSISRICSLPTLRQLSLDNVLFLESTIPTFCQNQCLQSLTLSLELQERECSLLAELVRTNRFIRNLSFCVTGPGPSGDDQHLLKGIQALEENTTIVHLDVRGMFTNHLWGDEQSSYLPTSDIKQGILSMLEKNNMTLRNIYFDPAPDPNSESAADDLAFLSSTRFYAKLNRIGRKGLLENPNARPEQWVDALTAVVEEEEEETEAPIESFDDVSAFFYFLSRNPLLCEVHQKRKLAVNDDQTSKRGRTDSR